MKNSFLFSFVAAIILTSYNAVAYDPTPRWSQMGAGSNAERALQIQRERELRKFHAAQPAVAEVKPEPVTELTRRSACFKDNHKEITIDVYQNQDGLFIKDSISQTLNKATVHRVSEFVVFLEDANGTQIRIDGREGHGYTHGKFSNDLVLESWVCTNYSVDWIALLPFGAPESEVQKEQSSF